MEEEERFEKCPACGAYPSEDLAYSVEPPPVDAEEEWRQIQLAHNPDCVWAQTRGYRVGKVYLLGIDEEYDPDNEWWEHVYENRESAPMGFLRFSGDRTLELTSNATREEAIQIEEWCSRFPGWETGDPDAAHPLWIRLAGPPYNRVLWSSANG